MKTILSGLTVAIAAAGIAVAAEALTVKDVLALKDLGYTDAQIKAEVERTKSTFTLTDADVKQLKEAGFDEAMIAALKRGGTPPKKLSRDELLGMVEAGRSVEAILDRILEGGTAIPMTMSTALELHRKKVPHAVIVALKGKPLTLAEIERLAGAGLSAKGWSKLAAIVGVAKTVLPAADAVALVRAGVPREIIARLKEGRPAARPAGDAQAPPAATGGLDTLLAKQPYVESEAEKQFIKDLEKKLAAGGTVEDKDGLGMTALHQAAGRNFVTAAAWLVGKGADINATDGQGHTPLALAAASGHLHVARFLLENKADAGIAATETNPLTGAITQKTPLAIATAGDDKEMVRLLRHYGAPAVAMAGAASSAFRKRVDKAIREGTVKDKVDAKGSTLLHLAAEKDFASEISRLISKGADVNAVDKDNRTPVMRAIIAGKVRSLTVLLEEKPNLDIQDTQGKMAMQYAMESGNLTLIGIVRNADMVQKWQQIVASKAESLETWKQIVAAAQVVPDRDKGQFSILEGRVADQEALARIKKDLAAGQDVEKPDQVGWTRLHWAASRGYEKTVKFLIEKGANLNARGQGGHTPLHVAAASGRLAVVKLLLEAGADPRIGNAMNRRPAETAKLLGHTQIAELLESKGG